MEWIRQKAGPLEVWQWAALGLLGLLGYMYFTKTGFFAPASSSAGATDQGTGTTMPLSSGQMGGGAPDFSAAFGSLATQISNLQDALASLAQRGPGNGVPAAPTNGYGNSTSSLGLNVNPADPNLNNPFINTALRGGPGGTPLTTPIVPPFNPNAQTLAQWQDYLAWKAQHPAGATAAA